MNELATLTCPELPKVVILVPLAMSIPNSLGVYDFSSYQPFLIVSEGEFDSYNPVQMEVGTPEKHIMVTAYGKNLSGWYLALPARTDLPLGDYWPPNLKGGASIFDLEPLLLQARDL